MTRRAMYPTNAGAAVAVAALLLGALLPGTASAGRPPASDIKTYVADGPDAAVPLVDGGTFAVTLTNTSQTQSFGSAQIRLPADRLAAPTGTSPTGWTVSASEDGSLVELTSAPQAGVEPGQALTVTFPVDDGTAPGRIQLQTRVKQSNDFSGRGNDLLGLPADVTVDLGHGPATQLVWEKQPEDIQVQGSTVESTGLTERERTCPQIEVRDAGGRPVSTPTMVTLTNPGGLRLGGVATLQATSGSNGVATFGNATCSAGITGTELFDDESTTASATVAGKTLTSAASEPFDVRQVAGDCTGDPCTVTGLSGAAKTTAGLRASGKQGDDPSPELTFDVAPLDSWTGDFGRVCDPDPDLVEGSNPFRDEVTVELAGYDKDVTLTWSKRAVQWATNNGAKKWDVCFAALYDFTAAGDTVEKQIGDDLWYVGALAPCPVEQTGPASPCLVSLGRNGGQQTATVHIPFNPLDPRMI